MALLRTFFAAAAAASLLLGCGGGADRTKANLRFINASTGYASLDLVVDDSLRFGAVAYGRGADYAEVDPKRTTSRVSAAGSSTPLVSLTPALVKQDHFTLVAYGRTGALKTVLLDDNRDAPDAGKALVRVLNAAPDAGAIDVYLTTPGDALGGAVPTQAAAAVGTIGGFATLDSATWRLRVTGAGDKTDLRLDRSDIVLDSRQVLTLVLTPAPGGVLVDALVLVQRGTVTPRAVQHARVRAAAGLPASGNVSASVGGVDLLAGAGSPAVGAYALVPAGDQPVAVAVDGAPWPSSTHNLVAGREYTLLVHKPASLPQSSWLEDDNRLPAAATQARLRLVHGMAGGTGPLSMTLDGLPVAGGVASGTASPPTAVNAGSQLGLSVTALGVAAPVFTASDRALVAGGVYSVFVLGGPTPADGLLRQDR